MSSFRILLGCLVVVLTGCQTRLPGDYNDGPAKNPAQLHLGSDGSYSFGATHSATASLERGRWYRVQDRVVMLVPDDSAKPQWFARVARKDALRQLRHSTNVRDVLR
jgi:hypothetical protein